MSIEVLLYLIDFLGATSQMMGIVAFCSIAAFVFCIFWRLKIQDDRRSYDGEEEKENQKNNRIKAIRIMRWSFISFILVMVISLIIPSQKTMYMMALASYSKQSIIPEKIVRALEVKLDEIIDEAKKCSD